MKHIPSRTLATWLAAVFCALFIAARAEADPVSRQAYLPVTTLKAAQAIRPGDRIAISCGGCGGFTTAVADQSRSFLHGYTCGTCGKKFVAINNPRGGSFGVFVYQDHEGHQSKLYRAN